MAGIFHPGAVRVNAGHLPDVGSQQIGNRNILRLQDVAKVAETARPNKSGQVLIITQLDQVQAERRTRRK